MKFLPFIFTALISGLIVFFIQEFRYSEAKNIAQYTGFEERGKIRNPSSTSHPIESSELRDSNAFKTSQKSEKTTQSAIRKMAQAMNSDAGRAQMRHTASMEVNLLYQELIDRLTLSPEEAEHFKGLLTDRITTDQKTKDKLMAQLRQNEDISTERILEFLNSEEDSARFKQYEKELPERGKLPGIRSALGDDLDKELENSLVRTLSDIRVEIDPDSNDIIKGLEKFTSGADFLSEAQNRWNNEDSLLKERLPSLLSPEQIIAFQTYTKQKRELEKLQLEMMEKHMAPTDAKESE